jgi:hypothetical protein
MGLWTPPGAATGSTGNKGRPAVDRQRKIYRCQECDTPFPSHLLAAFIRHVDRCGRASDTEQQEHIAREEANPFSNPGYGDPEAFRWIRKRAAAGKKATEGGRPA